MIQDTAPGRSAGIGRSAVLRIRRTGMTRQTARGVNAARTRTVPMFAALAPLLIFVGLDGVVHGVARSALHQGNVVRGGSRARHADTLFSARASGTACHSLHALDVTPFFPATRLSGSASPRATRTRIDDSAESRLCPRQSARKARALLLVVEFHFTSAAEMRRNW